MDISQTVNDPDIPNIAVLILTYNQQDKTLACLYQALDSVEIFNQDIILVPTLPIFQGRFQEVTGIRPGKKESNERISMRFSSQIPM